MSTGRIDPSHARIPGEPRPDISSTEEKVGEKTFADFEISSSTVEALAEKGITHPFPIQALTLPVALRRNDIIGQAKTGTGKTLGFGIPMLENIVGPNEKGWENLPASRRGQPQGLVVLPTRELAKQVAEELRSAASKRTLRVVEVYGGRAYEPQQKALKAGAEIVVGTPGRLIDLMKHGNLSLTNISTLVLDEADEMLDLGFLEDVETILTATPPNRHTMLFSATMPGPVITMARRYMSRPTHIRATDPEDSSATVQTVSQLVYRCHALNKSEVVARILQAKERGLTIIFTRTKRTAARLTDELIERGFAAGALHGDLGQGAREQALRAFRNGKVDVLVATDVAARGIDVDEVTHVINYQCPEDEKTYIHRIGRTGRAGQSGTAITFVDWEDLPRWTLINNALNLENPDPIETYHTSPHLYTDLSIPEGITGKLPRSQRTRAGLKAEKIEDLGETGKKKKGRSSGKKKSKDNSRRTASSSSSYRRGTSDQPSKDSKETNSNGAKRRSRPRRRTHKTPTDEG